MTELCKRFNDNDISNYMFYIGFRGHYMIEDNYSWDKEETCVTLTLYNLCDARKVIERINSYAKEII